MKIFSGFQRGVNLGGWFSQCDHSEERYNFFITQADFAVIKSWGCDHVRLPIDYDLLETADGTPKEQGYIRLGRAVSWARENGLHMVLDLHKTAGFSFDPDEHEGGFFENEAFQERFYRLWTRIARRFADSTDLLAFELLNEWTPGTVSHRNASDASAPSRLLFRFLWAATGTTVRFQFPRLLRQWMKTLSTTFIAMSR